jgi:hypothetical protein
MIISPAASPLRGIFPLNCLEVMEIVRIFAAEKQKKRSNYGDKEV